MSAHIPSKKKHPNVEEQVKKSLSHIINDFILANLKLIGIVIAVIIVIAAGWMGWNSYAKSLHDKALALEAEAFRLTEEINEAADDEEPKHSWEDVQALYQQLLDEYPRTPSAERALIQSGNLYYAHEQYAEAQQQFDAYLSTYPEGQLRYQAIQSLGYIYEQQGDYQQALVTFQDAEANAPDSQKAAVWLAIARNQENLGQTDQALATYQRVLDDEDVASGWKDMATERLNLLNPAPAADAPEPVSEEAESEPETVEPETTTGEE